MKRVLAIGALAGALAGCGTVQNFQRGSAVDATVYGGVDIAAARLNGPPREGGGTAADSLDVALSAVGDTITLPITICAEIIRAIDAAYFQPEKEPPPNPHRQPQPNDPQPAPLPGPAPVP